MKIFKKLISVFLVLAILVTAVGCGRVEKKKETPINVALPNDIVSLDVATTKDMISEAVARCIFSTLYAFDKNLNLVPSLAESSKQESALEWVFKLRQDVKFHDGSPLTAEDVKYSIERAILIDSADQSLFIIDTIDVVDTYTIKVITKEPCVNLQSIFVRVSTSIMSKNAMEKPDYNLQKPIGSGPFKLLERVEGKAISVERFDQYFVEPAKSKYMNFVIIPSEQERTSGMLNNTIDVVFRISSYDCNSLKLNQSVAVYEHNSTKMELMMFNPDYEPLNNLKVRQAIAHAIDRQNLVDNVLDGYGSMLNSMIAPPLMGSKNNDNFTFDPELSKELLKEAGYPDGFELSVVTYDMLRKKMIEYIKLDLAQVGIKLNYEFLEMSDYLDVIKQNQHKASIMSWTSNADPDSTFAQLYSKDGSNTINQSKFSDDRVEELILQGKEETDPEKRTKLYEEANQIVSDSYFFLPIYQPLVLVAATNNIGGVSVNSQGLFSYESLYRIENIA